MRVFLSIIILALLVGCSTSSPTVTHTESQNVIAPSIAVAKQQYHDGQLDTAALTLRAVLSADPKNQEAYYYLCLVNTARYQKEMASQPQQHDFYR